MCALGTTGRRTRRGCALVAAFLLGCVRAPVTPDHGVLTMLVGAWPSNVDPRFTPDSWSEKISRLVFAPLLDRAPDGSLVPSLAAEFWFESPIDLRVRLRDDALFSDGSPVTPDDVVATFEAIADPNLGSVKRVSLSRIESVLAIDARVVGFRLREPHAPITQVLATIGICSRSSLEAAVDGSMPTAGAGPYSFASIVRDQHLELSANEGWFGERPATSRLRFRVVPDSTVRALEMLRGGADLTQNDLPPHVVERLRRDPGLSVDSGPSTLVKYLVFNTVRAPLGDARVRRAIALGLDIGAIVEHKLAGQAWQSDGFLVPGSWAYEPQGSLWAYDPALARRLLDAAGLKADARGRRLTLLYRTSQDETSVAVALIMRRQLLEIGVELEVRSTEWGVFFADIKQGDFDVYSLTGVGIHDPDWFSFVLDSGSLPPNGANRGRYSSSALDTLLSQGRSTLDRESRAAIYAQVQRLIAAELPIVPLWHPDNVVVRRRDVQGYELRPDGLIDSLRQTRRVTP